MRIVGIALAGLLAVALLWVGGEMHRQNCIDTGRRGCSVLPWDNGHQKPAPPRKTFTIPGLG